MKKIGVFIRKPESLFSNGCFQQSLYTLKVMRNAGFDIELISAEPGYTEYEITGDKIRTISLDQDISCYSMILFGSAYSKEESWLKKLKDNNVKIVKQLGGNHFIIMQEDIIFAQHNTVDNIFNDYIDYYWLLPMYSFQKSFIEALVKKPVIVVPYVWDTDIIDEYCKQNNLDLQYKKRNSKDISTIIAEPNLSIHKNCMPPLALLEHFNIKNNESLKRVFLLCKKDNKYFQQFLRFLDIFKQNKVEQHYRLSILDVIHQLNKPNLPIPTMISHQLLNNLNFIHLEMFYYGYPIVHNCDPFQNCGYFYNEHNIEQGSKVLEQVKNHDDNLEDYLERGKKIIFRFSPSNPKNIKQYRKIINEILNN